MKASAWMLTNRSACTRRAFCTRMLQRHEEVGVAREEGAHRVAVDAGGVDAVAQPVRDLQHHVFLARAARADGARVLAAVAGVERDDDDPVGAARCRGAARQAGRRVPARAPCAPRQAALARRGRRRRAQRLRRPCRPPRGSPRCAQRCAHQVAERRRRPAARRDAGDGGAAVLRPRRVAQALGDQRLQRVDRLLRVQVEHQPVLVGRHRRQREHLRQRPAASGRTPGAPRPARTGRRGCRRCTGRRA